MNAIDEKGRKSSGRILFIGVGHAGIDVLCSLKDSCKIEDFSYAAVDSDIDDLSKANKNSIPIIQLGAETLRGAGTGGDSEMGAHLFMDESGTFAKLVGKHRLVIVIAGLGGGIGGAVETMLADIEDENVPVLLLGIMPFHFEGSHRKTCADDVLPRLALMCHAIILAPNDIIMSTLGDQPVASAFAAASEYLANVAMDLTIPMMKKNLFNVNPELIGTIGIDSNPICHIAQASCMDGDVTDICRQLEEHPLFKMPRFMEHTDKAIVLMRAGNICTEADMDNVMSGITHLLPHGIMDAAACADDDMKEKMRITVLLHFKGIYRQSDEEESALAKSAAGKTRRDGSSNQMEFSYDARGSLGIFAEDQQPVNKNEWIDVPTVTRLGIKIDKGNVVQACTSK